MIAVTSKTTASFGDEIGGEDVDGSATWPPPRISDQRIAPVETSIFTMGPRIPPLRLQRSK